MAENREFIGEISFDPEAMKNIVSKFGIKERWIMTAMGHTNGITVKRWLNGNDIYATSLARICSCLRLDPLQFFIYDGHRFETNLENLYRLERAGLSVGDVLTEHGIEAYQDNGEHAYVHAKERADKAYVSRIEEQIASARSADIAKSSSEELIRSTTDIIKAISKIQQDAYAHERAALEELREQMQSRIDELNRENAMLTEKIRQMQEA